MKPFCVIKLPGSVGRYQTTKHNKSILVFQRNSAGVKAKTSQASHWYFNPSVLVIQDLLQGFRTAVKYFHVVNGSSTCIKTTNYIDLKIVRTGRYTILWGNDHLIEFHLTFSVDRNFLIIWAFDRIYF